MTRALWVPSGPGLPCGARELGDAGDGKTWLDVCIMGQHLPQMYRTAELAELDAGGCARLGLCPDCLGFGDTSPDLPRDMLEAARGIDQITSPCPGCGGSGRPALRITLTRDASGGVTGDIRPLPHEHVPPLDDDTERRAMFGMAADGCLACGMPRDGTGPRGESLHT